MCFDPLDSCEFTSISKPKPFAAPATAGATSSDAEATTAAKKLKLPKKSDGAEIRATVNQDGVPRAEETVIAGYEIGADGTILGSPRKLKAKRKGKKGLKLSWKPGRGAVGYSVTVRRARRCSRRAP